MIGAALLVTGYWYAGVVAWAGVWLGITMLLACLAHFRVKDPISKTATAVVFISLIVILTIVNADGLILPFS
ncbi:hypothetical protein PAECIP111802_01288 [Paenibacillus allorhizosphaerae]|uniref:Uncharacterized protein n=1 Tax=Paenibacillus allorhizosphaerae TaxID=2849866 RepID=A0ABM8VD76_9BACL|nr:hypothetical protein PAECIP111802_01288 [Paenibacillus allorhizosphaerae]